LSAKGAGRALDAFVVAGEASGDELGASLMKKLRERLLGEIRFRGVGGTAMAAEGLASLFPMDDVTAMGFGSVIRKLPLILRRIRETADRAGRVNWRRSSITCSRFSPSSPTC
jgi:lipid-A-disaccharide synthase